MQTESPPLGGNLQGHVLCTWIFTESVAESAHIVCSDSRYSAIARMKELLRRRNAESIYTWLLHVQHGRLHNDFGQVDVIDYCDGAARQHLWYVS